MPLRSRWMTTCNILRTRSDLLVAGLRDGHDIACTAWLRSSNTGCCESSRLVHEIALQSAMGAENARNVTFTVFRAFRTEVREAFEDFQNPFVSIDVPLSWATGAFGVVKVRHERRCAGISNYTVGKLINHAFNLLTGFSAAPLRLVSIVGFAFTLFGFAVLVRAFGVYLLYGSPVPGFVFLATIVTLFSGVQLFTLGIFGEYLARVWLHHGSAGLCDEGNHGGRRNSPQ